MRLRENGKRAMMIFIGTPPGVKIFKPMPKDPKIAELLKEAKRKGQRSREYQ